MEIQHKSFSSDVTIGSEPRTVVATISLTGVAAPWIFEGAMNGTVFATYTQHELAPSLQADDIVIINSCTFDDSRDLSYGSLTLGNGGSTSGSVVWALFDIDRLSVTSITSTVSGGAIDMSPGGGTLKIGTSWNMTNMTFTPGTNGTVVVKVPTDGLCTSMLSWTVGPFHTPLMLEPISDPNGVEVKSLCVRSSVAVTLPVISM